MKAHKMFCIDIELVQKLKGINASSLVNELLTKHFEEEELNNTPLEQLIVMKDKLEAMEEYDRKLRELKGEDSSTTSKA